MKFESAIRIIWSHESGKIKWDRYRGFGVIERSAKSGVWCVKVGNESFLAIEEVEVSDRFESSEVSGGPFTKEKKSWNVTKLNGEAMIRMKNVAGVISKKCVGEVETRNGDLKKLIGEVETRNGDLKFGGIDRLGTGDLKLVEVGIDRPSIGDKVEFPRFVTLRFVNTWFRIETFSDL